MRVGLMLSSFWGLKKKTRTKPAEDGFQGQRGDFSLCEALGKLPPQWPNTWRPRGETMRTPAEGSHPSLPLGRVEVPRASLAPLQSSTDKSA